MPYGGGMSTQARADEPSIATLAERITTHNQSAGDKTAAALLALHRAIKDTHPDLFAEVSSLLHDALNDATHIAYDAADLRRLSHQS